MNRMQYEREEACIHALIRQNGARFFLLPARIEDAPFALVVWDRETKEVYTHPPRTAK